MTRAQAPVAYGAPRADRPPRPQYATADELPPGYIPKAAVLERGWTTKLIYAVLNPIGVQVPPTGLKRRETSPWWYPLVEVERLEATDPEVRHIVAVNRACQKVEPLRARCGHEEGWGCFGREATEAGLELLLGGRAGTRYWWDTPQGSLAVNDVIAYVDCADFNEWPGTVDRANAAQQLREILPMVFLQRRLQRDHEFAVDFLEKGASDWPREWLVAFSGVDFG